MNRQTVLNLAARLALLTGAALLASGGFLSIAVTDCAWNTGWLCGGDLEALLEGYVVGVALMTAAAALAARAVTRRWSLIAAAAFLGVAGSVLFVLYTEQLL